MKQLIAVVLLCLASASWAATKVYKWVDEEGRIHYSGQKPPNQEVETLNVRTGARSTSNADAATAEAAETEAESAAEDGTDAEVDAEAEAEARAQLAAADRVNNRRECEQARNNLDSLNRTVRVTQRDAETGEVRRLTDDERVAALANAQKAIQQYCR